MLIEKNYDIGKCIAPKRCDVWGTCFFLPAGGTNSSAAALSDKSDADFGLGAASLSEAAGPIFQSNFMDFVRIYLAGICLLGLPLLVLFLFLKGFSLGFSACFLVTHSPLLLLSRLLYFPVLLAAIAYSCRFSFILLQNRVSSPAAPIAPIYSYFWFAFDFGIDLQLY